MPSCAFEKCRNHSRKENKTHGITFHAFPQDESWSYKWVRVVRKQRREPAWSRTTHSRVCSLHFQSEDMYTTEKGLKKITNGAVPSFREKKRTEYADTNELITIHDPNKFNVEAKPTRSTSTDSETSNTELAPEETLKEGNKFLKRKIERVIANKRKLLIMNKKLKRQNKRLIEKCKSLKGIVSHLMETVTDLESKLEKEPHNK